MSSGRPNFGWKSNDNQANKQMIFILMTLYRTQHTPPPPPTWFSLLCPHSRYNDHPATIFNSNSVLLYQKTALGFYCHYLDWNKKLWHVNPWIFAMTGYYFHRRNKLPLGVSAPWLCLNGSWLKPATSMVLALHRNKGTIFCRILLPFPLNAFNAIIAGFICIMSLGMKNEH